MNIIIKRFYYVLLLLLVSCGYEPIHLKNGDVLSSIQSFKVEGDKRINRKIVRFLNLTNQNQTDGYKLIINSKKSIVIISKDKNGNASTYNTTVTTVVSLMDGDKIYKEQNFTSNFTYNNTKNKSELTQYQQDIESNLVDTIIEEISIFLTRN
tara:strand:+ start:78 stop:536 length:459 start_codon:yes stop_codon:yes gene_type:complete